MRVEWQTSCRHLFLGARCSRGSNSPIEHLGSPSPRIFYFTIYLEANVEFSFTGKSGLTKKIYVNTYNLGPEMLAVGDFADGH
jgi:hypothetical protein